MAADLLFASGAAPYTAVLIALVSSGTVLLAIRGLVKLGQKFGDTDRDVASLAQAQGANEVLRATLDEVVKERDYWKAAYEHVTRLSQPQGGTS